MGDEEPPDWRERAERRLREVDGLFAADARVGRAYDRNATDRAAAIEAALDRSTEAAAAESRAVQAAARTVEAALARSDGVVETATTRLANAIESLVASSNSNTSTMAGLQKWIILLTVAYVALTAVIAWVSWRGVTQ